MKFFSFQVSSTGGPQPQAHIEFSMQAGSIASVSSAGLVEALQLGNTTLVGRAVGTDPESGTLTVYSQVSSL